MNNTQNKKTIIVLGMHRSGTSTIAGILRILGVDMGQNFDPVNRFNVHGYHEDLLFQKLNDKILSQAGGSWDNPPEHQKIISLNFDKDIKKLIENKKGYWGWKDPRNSLTMELFLPHLIDPHLIVCHRRDKEIMGSLKTREGFDSSVSQKIIAKYNNSISNLLKSHPNLPCLHISYSVVQGSSIKTSQVIADYIGIKLTDEKKKEIKKYVLNPAKLKFKKSLYLIKKYFPFLKNNG